MSQSAKREACENCGGEGEVWWQDTSLGSGRGRLSPREGYDKCEKCDGEGWVEVEEEEE